MKIKNWQRMNPTRPVVDGVHNKRYDPQFIKRFDVHQDDFAGWFVDRVKRGDTKCTAQAIGEWEKAGGG